MKFKERQLDIGRNMELRGEARKTLNYIKDQGGHTLYSEIEMWDGQTCNDWEANLSEEQLTLWNAALDTTNFHGAGWGLQYCILVVTYDIPLSRAGWSLPQINILWETSINISYRSSELVVTSVMNTLMETFSLTDRITGRTKSMRNKGKTIQRNQVGAPGGGETMTDTKPFEDEITQLYDRDGDLWAYSITRRWPNGDADLITVQENAAYGCLLRNTPDDITLSMVEQFDYEEFAYLFE